MKKFLLSFLVFSLLFPLKSVLSAEFQGFERLKSSQFADESNVLDRFEPHLSGNMKIAADSDAQWVCEAPERDGKTHAVVWSVVLNQKEPLSLYFSGESRSEGVSGSENGDYSLYLDIIYEDGTPRWGVTAPFSGSKNWEEKFTLFAPEKPIKRLTMYALFRNQTGKAAFRNVRLVEITPEKQKEILFFDGTQVRALSSNSRKVETPQKDAVRFYIRDAAADSNWVRMTPKKYDVSDSKTDAEYNVNFTKNEGEKQDESKNGNGNNDGNGAADSEFTLLQTESVSSKGITHNILKIRSERPIDRCVTLVAAVPVPEKMTEAFLGLNKITKIGTDEISSAFSTLGGMKRMNRFPLLGVGNQNSEFWLGITPAFPAVYRTFYNPSTQELCIAYDLGFIPEKCEWELHFCRFEQRAGGGLRAAWDRYMQEFPDAFEVRTKKMGVWMPFAPISKVENPDDFGFVFKEGTDEPQWDDSHGVLTFRYTEPMTWWMRFKVPEKDENENQNENQNENNNEDDALIDAGIQEAKRLAETGNEMAQMWENSVMYDKNQRPAGIFLDTPWCCGIVWSTSGLPNISEPSDFRAKFSEEFKNDTYGKQKTDGDDSGIDGEYIDSSEGYVTTELDFRRSHFLAVETPLTFSLETKTPAILRGLTTFEYVRGIEKPVHASGRLMMANSTPIRLSWLAPLLDVLGTETNWNWNGNWSPMEISEMQYRRLLCGKKPYCFLQNTDFTKFTYEMSDKFMQRSLAFGFFPGYFSADAATGHYFSNPELYNRDRPLFCKYIPLCRLAAEAGWEPETGVKVRDERLLIERFGRPDAKNGGIYYLTVFNPTNETIPVELSDFAPNLNGKTEVLVGKSPLEPEAVMMFKVTKNK